MIFRAVKIKKKSLDIFVVFVQNFDCGYRLVVVLPSTHNLMFLIKIRQKMYTPAYPIFTI